MKKILFLIAATLLAACNSAASPSAASTSSPESNMKNLDSIKITVGSAKFTARIEDSETGRAFVAKLPMTLDMNEHLGNEKYANGVSLPVNAKYYGTIDAGDLMLYGSDCIVLFYGSAGGYSYTPIGKLADTTGLAKALGAGKVKVTFSK